MHADITDDEIGIWLASGVYRCEAHKHFKHPTVTAMVEAAQIIPITRPGRVFRGHVGLIIAVAVFPDGRRMVSGSWDRVLRLWDLKDGTVLKEMKGHQHLMTAMRVSGDGKLIASADKIGLIAWDGDTGECVTIKAHTGKISSLDFSPDGAVLIAGAQDRTINFWGTDTWEVQGNPGPINCDADILCIRRSPSGDLLAVATDYSIQIWNLSVERIAEFTEGQRTKSLTWTPDGTRLISASILRLDHIIRVWNTSTWKQVGDPWSGHTSDIYTLAINSAGTLLASASEDNNVRLWRLSDQRTIAIFSHSYPVQCVTFSTDGKYILSGGRGEGRHITEWDVPNDFFLEDPPEELSPEVTFNSLPSTETFPKDDSEEQKTNNTRHPHYKHSAAIDLDRAIGTIFASRCKVKLGKMLWKEALIDAQKVTELDPSSYLGYHLKHAALHGAQQYDEAINAFQSMLLKLDHAHDPELQALRKQYIFPSVAQAAIRKVIDAQMEDTPPHLLDTSTGRLCDRTAQINSFLASTEYKELLSSTIKHSDIQSQRIQHVVLMFFQYVMLSHRWEGNEPLLHDIQGKCVYKLSLVDGIGKLQSFCRVTRDRGYRWAWSDTCCINKNNNIDLQESVNSMFVWYRHSALTIIYLSDVSPLFKSGALANSVWITRGWTVQEFLAPKVVLFYQQDWTLYLDNHSPNHKESTAIMRELADATGINTQALIEFRPEMRGAREKLQWSSMRVTTLQEDIAYSLFGVFGVYLPPIYGEKKQNALGRLLQEIIAQSGDISCLDWIGKSSEFNSCLPASITSYAAPPFELPSLSEDEMEASVSSIRDTGIVGLASQLYTTLDQQPIPRFAHRRLHLPCIVFTVTQVASMPSQERGSYFFTYAVKANGLHDLLITTEDKLTPISRKMPNRQKLLVVRPWNHNLLEPSFSEDDVQSIMTDDSLTPPSSPSGQNEEIDLESDSRALRLVVRLGQPFRAFLLAQQQGREYNRITADHDIIAKVKDVASVRYVMDVRTLEIL